MTIVAPRINGHVAFVTVICPCKRKASDGLSLHPRYCGAGRHVLKLAPPRYARRWADAPSAPAEDVPSVPVPQVLARPALPHEIPPSCLTLRALAERSGFSTAVTYARGTPVHSVTGRPLGVRDSVLLRGAHSDGRRFGAQWVAGTADNRARKVRDPLPDGGSRVTDLSDSELRAWLVRSG